MKKNILTGAVLLALFFFAWNYFFPGSEEAAPDRTEQPAPNAGNIEQPAPDRTPAELAEEAPAEVDTIYGLALVTDWKNFDITGAETINLGYKRAAAEIQKYGNSLTAKQFFLTNESEGSDWVPIRREVVLEFYKFPGALPR
jgi:hypothetical protein